MDIGKDFVSLSDCLRLQSRYNPDTPSLVYRDQSWSFRKLDEWVETVARNLWQRGVRPGNRVATFQNRRPGLVAGFLALIRAGGLPVPINIKLRDDRLTGLLKTIRPEWVLAESHYSPLLERHRPELPPRDRWILKNNAPDDCCSWSDLEQPAPKVDFLRHEPHGDCYIHFTSGTSGQPKGVLCTHENVWANTLSANVGLSLGGNDRHLNLFASFAHPHEIVARPLHLGGLMVLSDTIRPDMVLEAICLHGVTCIMGVPTLYASLFRPLLKDPRLKTIRVFEAGGGVTPENLITRFAEEIGVPITPVWGSTETSGIALAGPPSTTRPPGSVGRLCPGFEARIITDDGDVASIDEPGQLQLRGKAVIKGYLDLPDETAKVLQNGWYQTGDLFCRDGNDCFYFKGRVDEMFKHRGFKIYPREVEEVVLRHPAVDQVAVVGRTTEKGEQEPLVFVSCKPGSSITSGELRSFCRERLASYQVPRDVVVRDRLPTTGSGKILKAELLEELQK